jgi:hypothetical protein
MFADPEGGDHFPQADFLRMDRRTIEMAPA